MINHLTEVLTPEDLADIRSALANATWEDGRDSAGLQARRAKNNQQLAHSDPAAELVRRRVVAGLERHPVFFSAALPKRLFTPRVNRYQGEADRYGPHIDNAVRLLPDGQRVRTDLSCTVFLNPPDEYAGGELVIHDAFGPRSVKLAAGDAVLYPGTSLHEVRPVTQGARMACFLWIESLVRGDEQRRLLHELDLALLALRERHGESPETDVVTGTYHNLLRLWADT